MGMRYGMESLSVGSKIKYVHELAILVMEYRV